MYRLVFSDSASNSNYFPWNWWSKPQLHSHIDLPYATVMQVACMTIRCILQWVYIKICISLTTLLLKRSYITYSYVFICFNKADRSHVHCIKKIIKIQVRIHNMTISWHQCATRTFVFIRTIKHHRSFGLYVFSQEGERVSLSFSSGTSNNANSPKSLQISQRRSQTTNHKPTATGK